MSYVELHACSAFSFLRGGSFPEQLAEVTAELKMPAMALLDRNGVYGTQRFSVAAREHGVRPIVGSELTMEDRSVLPVLVKDSAGYKNLCELLTQAHLRSVKGECGGKWSELPEFGEGVVVLLGSGSARASRAVSGALAGKRFQRKTPFGEAPNGAREGACAPQNPADRAQFLIDVFHRENVYVEIQRHFLRGEDQANQQLCDLAEQHRLPVIATNGVQYARPYGR